MVRCFARGWLGMLGLLLALGGCVPAPRCDETSPEVADIDFARLQLAVDLSDDITQYNMGLKTEADLRARWEIPEVTLEFIQVLGNPYTYMLFTDETRQIQAIVLSGTTREEEWLLDFQTTLVYDEELDVNLHEGWRIAARAVAMDVEPRLLPDHDLWIFGYSLGAGTGAILGLYLEQILDVDVAAIVAVGMPRVTDAAGAAAFENLPLLRVAAGNDIIPFAPVDPYVTIGQVIVLLDGPFVSRQYPTDPDYDNRPTTREELEHLDPDDHISYVARMQDKVNVPVCYVPYAERQDYLD